MIVAWTWYLESRIVIFLKRFGFNFDNLPQAKMFTTKHQTLPPLTSITNRSVYEYSVSLSIACERSLFNLHVIKGLGFARDMELGLLKSCYRLHFLCKSTSPLRRSSFFKSFFFAPFFWFRFSASEKCLFNVRDLCRKQCLFPSLQSTQSSPINVGILPFASKELWQPTYRSAKNSPRVT